MHTPSLPVYARQTTLANNATVQQQFSTFLDLLEQWNRVHNLTALRSRAQMHEQLIEHSLLLLPYLYTGKIVDIGSGAGVPGLILAIALPDTAFTLIDARAKKTAFLRKVVHQLDLDNVHIISDRAENYDGEPFDILICRALGNFQYIEKISSTMRHSNSHYFCIRGAFDASELQGTAFHLNACIPLRLQTEKQIQHCGNLVIIQR